MSAPEINNQTYVLIEQNLLITVLPALQSTDITLNSPFCKYDFLPRSPNIPLALSIQPWIKNLKNIFFLRKCKFKKRQIFSVPYRVGFFELKYDFLTEFSSFITRYWGSSGLNLVNNKNLTSRSGSKSLSFDVFVSSELVGLVGTSILDQSFSTNQFLNKRLIACHHKYTKFISKPLWNHKNNNECFMAEQWLRNVVTTKLIERIVVVYNYRMWSSCL